MVVEKKTMRKREREFSPFLLSRSFSEGQRGSQRGSVRKKCLIKSSEPDCQLSAGEWAGRFDYFLWIRLKKVIGALNVAACIQVIFIDRIFGAETLN